MSKVEIYIDGASKGNPGPSGIGVVISANGKALKNISRFIGHATNNIAEYTALIYGLQEALIMRLENINLKTDSQLLYRQIRKEYKVKHPNITGLYEQALHLLSAFNQVSLELIPREQNRGADRLATSAIKQQLKKKTCCLIKK
jgi:ribonuclease HI